AKPDQSVGSAAAEQSVGVERAGAGQPGADEVERLDIIRQDVVDGGRHDIVTGARVLVHQVAGRPDEVEVVADATAEVVDARRADQGVGGVDAGHRHRHGRGRVHRIGEGVGGGDVRCAGAGRRQVVEGPVRIVAEVAVGVDRQQRAGGQQDRVVDV